MLSEFIISNNVSNYTSIAIITGLFLIGIGLIITFSHFIAKYLFISVANKLFDKKRLGWSQLAYNNHLIHRIAYFIPGCFIYYYSALFDFTYPRFQLLLSGIVKELATIYLIISASFILSAILNCINDRYNQLSIARHKPIKSYTQIIKIFIFGLASILVASLVLDKSPGYLFASIGAATALFALVFKDSIMGFVASIQLSAYDMVRIGDWIEMPNYGVDGEVADIALNTVTVRNFDLTMVTIPSYALLTSGLKNWRSMHEAGARRVKRSIFIDINSIKIANPEFLQKLSHFGDLTACTQATNLGVFRYYLNQYLRQRSDVHQGMRILVRQLQGTVTGLPLELYFFTRDTQLEKYEAVQADIFEHVYTLIPQFDLRIFQSADSVE